MALRADDPRLTVGEWNELEDPPGYRFEILRGELDVTPGATPEHGRALGELYVALRRKLPNDLRIVIDIDWHLMTPEARVTMAPRPDVMVIPREGPIVPILVVEVLSPSDQHKFKGTGLTRIENKRLDYADAGLRHYLEVDLAAVTVARFELHRELTAGQDELVDVEVVEHDGVLVADEPFPYVLVPQHFV